MDVARAVTQWFLKSSALPALTILGGALRLDRLYDRTYRWARRGKTRLMTPFEIHEAERVFGNTIPFEDVRIVEASSTAQRVARASSRVHLEQSQSLAVTVFYTIHFSRTLRDDGQDMPWLIHELTHVWQYHRMGMRYLARALQVQAAHGHEAYDIEHGVSEGWEWESFNLEQQGDIAKAFYKALIEGQDSRPYQPYIAVLKGAA